MKRVLMLAVLLTSLSACGGGDGTVDNRIGFNEFIIDEISNTNANDEPAGINSIEFRFSNQNDSAFDSLL